jgi:hypothetical protein
MTHLAFSADHAVSLLFYASNEEPPPANCDGAGIGADRKLFCNSRVILFPPSVEIVDGNVESKPAGQWSAGIEGMKETRLADEGFIMDIDRSNRSPLVFALQLRREPMPRTRLILC